MRTNYKPFTLINHLLIVRIGHSMASQLAQASALLGRSQQSSSEGGGVGVAQSASSTPNTLYEHMERSQTDQSIDILTIETYLAQEKALRQVRDTFERVKRASSQRPIRSDERTTTQAIH